MNTKRTTQWKTGQETFKRHFVEVEKHEDTKIYLNIKVHKRIKRCLTLLVIREMEIWTTVTCSFMSIVVA